MREQMFMALAFIGYVANTSSHMLLVGYSQRVLKQQYNPSEAVMAAEVIKLFIASLLSFRESGSLAFQRIVSSSLPMSIPAALYFVQNSIYYLALKFVSPAVFVTLAQMKLLITAVFAVMFLSRNFSREQWRALVLLTLGAILVNSKPGETYSVNSLLGPLLILILSSLAAISGIYFEKVLKGTSVSVWQRNVQLAAFSCFFGFVSIYVFGIGEQKDATDSGVFQGFTPLVWLIVILQASGGLFVAVIVKYADNIIKNFGSTISIIVTSFGDYFLFRTQLSLIFAIGAVIILMSIQIYRDGEIKEPNNYSPVSKDDTADQISIEIKPIK